MVKRSHARSHTRNWRRDLALFDPLYDRPDLGRIITVTTPLPLSIAQKARRKIYPYSLPLQNLSLKRHVVRHKLRTHPGPYVLARVRIKLPSRLPVARASYVSLDRNRLNIHSVNQYRRAIQREELNRRRYDERKTNRRKGRHGQLDSPGSTAFGSVAAAHRAGWSVSRIADSAMAARAILKGRKR